MKRTVAGFLCLLAVSAVLPATASSTANQAAEERAIRALLETFSAAIAAKDLGAVMALYAPDVVAFDAFPPRQYLGAAAYRKAYVDFFAAFPGPAHSDATDVVIRVAGDLAYAYGVDHWTVTDADKKVTEMSFRYTDILSKASGRWLIVHEHLSFPVDPASGVADFSSKP